ncbi:hypothetical protein [Dietzia sp.]|uniref:hypothetical protein n=1 Tax=Dietzia sp. TaxID=1871616 RepID=UPI002FDB3650
MYRLTATTLRCFVLSYMSTRQALYMQRQAIVLDERDYRGAPRGRVTTDRAGQLGLTRGVTHRNTPEP